MNIFTSDEGVMGRPRSVMDGSCQVLHAPWQVLNGPCQVLHGPWQVCVEPSGQLSVVEGGRGMSFHGRSASSIQCRDMLAQIHGSISRLEPCI